MVVGGWFLGKWNNQNKVKSSSKIPLVALKENRNEKNFVLDLVDNWGLIKVLSKIIRNTNGFFANRTQSFFRWYKTFEEQLNIIQPDIILNCGTYTAVDKAELETELADLVNHHQSVQVLAMRKRMKWS
jgi:dTDP-4-dehydrorhamnose reductase